MEDDVGGSGEECPRSFGAGMGRAPRPYLLPLLALLIWWGGGVGARKRTGELVAPRPFTQRTVNAISQVVTETWGGRVAESIARNAVEWLKCEWQTEKQRTGGMWPPVLRAELANASRKPCDQTR